MTQHEQTSWDAFVKQHGPRSGRFLQSWQWGEFQKTLGRHVDRIYIDQDGDLAGVAQSIRTFLPIFGCYDYVPRGPIVKSSMHLADTMKKISGECLFVRFDALSDTTESLAELHLHKSIDVQPAHTVINKLEVSEEELLKHMHSKTRYNIGLAEKKNLDIRMSDVSLDQVWSLFSQTSKRGAFRLHEHTYYETMLTVLAHTSPRVFLAAAFYEDQPVAATIMLDFGETRTYLHGASAHEHRTLMAPSLLHWELMKDAKRNGLKAYDWWGVSPPLEEQHPWAGISRFKRGFGGEEVEYPGTYDLVSKPVGYWIYQMVRKIRRLF